MSLCPPRESYASFCLRLSLAVQVPIGLALGTKWRGSGLGKRVCVIGFQAPVCALEPASF